MQALWQDLRLAWRSFSQAPGFTLVAVLSLGLGIGAMSTIYLWADRFILNPLPGVPDAARLSFIRTRAPEADTWSISYPTYLDWRERNRAFEGLAVKTMETVGVRERDGEAAERAFGLFTSGNYFDVLGVRALHGRTLRLDDEQAAAQVAVLGHSYWARRFGADPGVVGRSVIVNGQPFDVVGVMPPGFGGSYVGLDLDLYLPVTTWTSLKGGDRLTDRGSMFLEGIGRRPAGLSLAAAVADMERVGADLDALYPQVANHAAIDPLDEQGAPATMKPVFAALLGVTALVLLIACVNVANLLLARATARRKEIALRTALGASRGRLMRQLLTESVLLAGFGAWLGLTIAWAGRGGMMALLPPTPFPVAMSFEMNYRVVTFALVVAAATVALFGLWPAFRASRPDLAPVLKGGVGSNPAGATVRSVLVGGQMALAVVALVCAGLFLRAIDHARTADPGFRDPASLLLVGTDLTIAGLDRDSGREAVTRLLERAAAVPGVSHAAVSSFVPLGWSCCSSANAVIEGYTAAPDENTSVAYSRVSDGYLTTMGIDLVAGRDFSAADRSESPRVILVNQRFVARYWPGVEPIGRRVNHGGTDFTVVGVVRDGHYRTISDRPFPLIYRVFDQSYSSAPTLHVRAAGTPESLIPALRREFLAVNPDLPFLDPRTMRQNMQQATIGQEIGSRTLTVFGLVSLLLASVGIYGVMAYMVGQRTREIGVRVALGAATGSIAGLVVRRGLVIALSGAAVGSLAAVGVGQLLQGMLLGINPLDALTFSVIVVLLLLVSIGACVIPARRAARVDPVIALKAE